MRDVFISYAREDEEQATSVCELLEERGVACWIAPRDVAPGAVWDEAILDAIESATAFVLILSASANESKFVKNEVNRAFSSGKPIIAFRIEDVLPGRALELYLARHHWTDGFPPPLNKKIDKLAVAIRAVVPVGDSPAQGTGAATVVIPPRKATRLARLRSTFRRMPTRERFAWSLTVTVSVALVIVLGSLLAKSPSPAARDTATRALISVAPADGLLGTNPNERNRSPTRPSRTAMAWSPDGKHLVFSGVRGEKQQLWMRPLDRLEATPIAGTENGDSPFLSPDGRWVGFWSAGELKKAPIGGGPVVTIAKTSEIFGASWGVNDTIIFARLAEGLWQVPASGGTPGLLTTLDALRGEISHRLPHILPDGKAVLYTIQKLSFRWDNAEIAVRSLVTGKQTVLLEGGTDARYVPTGHLVYARMGTLMAVPFDPTRLALTGGAIGMVDGVMHAINLGFSGIDTGAAQFSVSGAGTMAYVAGTIFPDEERSLVWIDREGHDESLPLPPRSYLAPRLSPDGQRLAFCTQGTERHVWLYDLVRGTMSRLTTEGWNGSPNWRPDGKALAFESSTSGAMNLFWKPTDGTGAVERLTTSEDLQRTAAWLPDGKTLAFVQIEPKTGRDIWTVGFANSDRTPKPFLRTVASEQQPDFSPDGRWVAYVSDESGRDEVYVQAFPGPGPRHQVSTEGGTQPAWARTGRELFYTVIRPGTRDAQMMVVDVTSSPHFAAGAPKSLPSLVGITVPTRSYDVSADGRRFITVRNKERPPEPPPAQMILVQDWQEELKRRVPRK